MPSAGASSAASRGAPYSGDQPSTKIRAIPAGYYVRPPTPPDRCGQGVVVCTLDVSQVPPSSTSTVVRTRLGQQWASPGR